MKEYDVIIAGAGPAGLSAAIELSKKKVSCLLLEKGKIGESQKIWGGFYDQIKNQKLQEGIVNTVSRGIISSPQKKITIKEKLVSLDEKKILLILKNRTNKNFCKIKEQNGFVNFERKGNKLIIKSDKEKYVTKLFIDASGVKSPLVRKLNLQKETTYMQCFGCLFNKTNVSSYEAILFDLTFKNNNNSYFWVYPLGNKKAWIGTQNFVKEKNKKSVTLLEKDLINYMKNKNLVGKKILTRSGFIPLHSSYKTYLDNIILVGDAASQIASNGYGLISSINNGKIAAKIALQALQKNNFKKKFLKRYEKEWTSKLGINYHFSQLTADLIYSFNFDQFITFINILAKQSSGLIVKGIKSKYTLTEARKLIKIIKKQFPFYKILKIIPLKMYPTFFYKLVKFSLYYVKNRF